MQITMTTSSVLRPENLVLPRSPPLKHKIVVLSRKPSLMQAFKSTDMSYAPLLELFATQDALKQAQQVHAHMIKSNVSNTVFLSTKLVFAYGKCGSISDAERLFGKMRHRTNFTWNAMIGAYVSNGDPSAALEIFSQMRLSGVPLDSCTFPLLLKACAALEYVRYGAEIHGLAVKYGCDTTSSFVANSLVSMYAKCNHLDVARKLFDRMNERNDVVSWNAMISSYSNNRRCAEALELFRAMQKAGVSPNTYTFVAILQACDDSSLRKAGMEIHAATVKSSQFLDVYVANALVAMYLRLGKMAEATAVFDNLDHKDKITWNSMLMGFVQNGFYREAFHFFHVMQSAGPKPDQVSIMSIASASGRLGYLLNGKEIHAYALKNGCDSNLHVGNTLIDMYAKCCCMTYARRAFDRMTAKDSISWTTVVAGYIQNNCHREALELFRHLQMYGMDVDTMMIGSILMACSELKCLSQLKEVHGYTIRHGLSDHKLRNTIVDAYGECGDVDYAARMFESIECKDVVSWTSMISSYVHNGLANEAFEVFYSMRDNNVEPDSITVVSILSAAASLAFLRKGKEIHGFIIRKGFMLEASVVNSLIDTYARCGSLEMAYNVFIGGRNRSPILWTSMINAYGMHGRGEAAVKLFTRMVDQELIPDHITFLALLYACSHSGLTDEGKKYFEIMKSQYQLDPWPEHYACLVDLLGRANHLEEAHQFVKSMQIEPTAEVWSALLGACRIHSNRELGKIAADKLLKLKPDNPGNYVLVSNVFAASGRWKDVEEVRMRMMGGGLNKKPGCSWIEVENKVHVFLARDKSHPESDEIYQKLAQITDKLERKGSYVPQTKFVLHNVGEEEKVKMLYGHSERLAIAYGLLRTVEGTTIRISKNLRICGDCHTFCKLISKYFGRELVVRDASRFHHFEAGVCSCGEFW